MTTKQFDESSREYEYGPGKEFPTKEAAMAHAEYILRKRREFFGDELVPGNPPWSTEPIKERDYGGHGTIQVICTRVRNVE